AENFFLEIQDHGIPDQQKIGPMMASLAEEVGLGLVGTNDSHYLEKDDAFAHEVLLCIGTGKTLGDERRMKFYSDDFYVKGPDEMERIFAQYPEAVANTMRIADRVNMTIDVSGLHLPKFPVPKGLDPATYFEKVVRDGRTRPLNAMAPLFAAKRKKHEQQEYWDRLEREIEIIKGMGFPGYFLVVWDFIKYAKDNGIPVGPGRGSGAVSLVAYSMGITDVDPLDYDLLFERFLNPERISMPDIDVDFCMNRRGEVIDYVTRKYGRENVAQIIAFGTMAAKAAIKDVCRAMDVPYNDVDRIAKMVPTTLNIKLETAIKESPALQQAYENDTQVKQLIDTAMKLEGLVRNAGVHAAGVVISPRPLNELVPLYRTKNDEIVTAFDMVAIEKMGLLKMDFLGLTTLTILDDTLKLIKQARGEALKLETLPLHDEATYEKVFHSGLTSGVFQFESHGMRDVLRRYKPNSIAGLTALTALDHPTPIQGGMIDDFIDRKHGRKKIEYELPELQVVL